MSHTTSELRAFIEALLPDVIDNLRNFAQTIGLMGARADDALARITELRPHLPQSEAFSQARQLLMTEAIAARSPSFIHVWLPDQIALDPSPDDCWRCDATVADGPLGLCTSCREDLT